MDDGAVWRYQETGSGRPLVLLHGIGMSHAAWNAVTPYLRATRRVIAFDIAGFGLTPPLPAGTLPTIANLVEALERSLHEMGLGLPIDVAGNSLGGCMALEAARRGIARSVVAISPIGLWRAHPAPHVKYVFRGMRLMARYFPNLLKASVRGSWLRELALAVPLSVGSRRMPVSDALRAVDDLAASPAFEETFDNTRASVLRTRHHGSRDGGVWRSRLDSPEEFTAPDRASRPHHVDHQARLGSCADVGRSARCCAAHSGRHSVV